MITEKNC